MLRHDPGIDPKPDRAGGAERFSDQTTASIVLPLPSLRGAIHAVLLLIALGATFLLLRRFAAVLFTLFAGITVGVAFKPAVEWLHRRHVPRWLGALGVYLALAGIVTGLALFAVPLLGKQLATLAGSAPAELERLRGALRASSSHTLREAAARVPDIDLAASRLLSAPLDIARVAELLPYARSAGRAVVAVGATLLLAFFWTVEGERRLRALALLAPLDRRRGMRAFVLEAERKVGAYVRGQALVCAAIGGLAWAAYALLGLPCAFALGLVYAAGEAVPVLGPLVGTMAAVAVALSVDPALALWVVAVAVGLQLTENYLLVPRVMKKAVGVNPLVTLLALSGFGSVFGVAGAVMAIPMAAVAQLALDRFVLRASADAPERPAGRDRASVLRYQVRAVGADVRKLLRLPDATIRPHVERLEDAVETLAADLDRVLARGERQRAGRDGAGESQGNRMTR